MEPNTILYKQAGLSEHEIKLLKTPFSDMQKGESQQAIAISDKLDAFLNKKAKHG